MQRGHAMGPLAKMCGTTTHILRSSQTMRGCGVRLAGQLFQYGRIEFASAIEGGAGIVFLDALRKGTESRMGTFTIHGDEVACDGMHGLHPVRVREEIMQREEFQQVFRFAVPQQHDIHTVGQNDTAVRLMDRNLGDRIVEPLFLGIEERIPDPLEAQDAADIGVMVRGCPRLPVQMERPFKAP